MVLRSAALIALALAGFAAAAPAARAEDRPPLVLAQADEPPLLLRLFGVRRQEPAAPPGAKIIRVKPGEPRPPAFIDPGRRPAPGEPVLVDPLAPKRLEVKPAEPAPPPKDADARRVLVVGDRLAEDLARGLDVAFAETPSVRIDGAAVAGSGLAADQPVDWVSRVAEAVAGSDGADAVVVMVGVEDMRPIVRAGVEVAFRTPEWEAAYRARVRGLTLAARSRNVPVFVVGLVPMGDIDLTTDVAYLDEIIRQEAQSAFTTYVNVWNEFADETGGYSASGPDVDGQVRQLRLKDGIGFTRSGSRKLAFYVEQEIRSWVERGAPGLVLPQSSGDGLVISLTDPEASLGEGLAGEGESPPPKAGTPLHDLVVLGRPPAPVTGRVDDLAVR